MEMWEGVAGRLPRGGSWQDPWGRTAEQCCCLHGTILYLGFHGIFPTGVWGTPQHVCVSCSVGSNSVTPWTVACQAPLSMGILQARILEWVAVSFSRGSS